MTQPLPPEFLAARRELLIAIARRVFKGSREPIPGLPALGDFPLPRPNAPASPKPPRKSRRKVRSSPPRERPTEARGHACYSVTLGTIPVGSVVHWIEQTGKVLAFLPAFAEPRAFISEGFPRTRIMSSLTPCRAPRYLVEVMTGGKPRLFLPRAATLERVNPELARRAA